MNLRLWLAFIVLAVSAPSFGATVIYQNDFETQIGPGWFGANLTTTPSGCIHCTSFLGEFGNDLVVFVLDGLPAHTSITFTFDVYAIRSWDGNTTAFGGGPDIFRVRAVDSNVDFETTFSNNYQFGSLFSQAFPGTYPQDSFPSQLGALEKQTLGYFFGPVPEDAIYHLQFSFLHSSPSLVFAFEATGLSPLSDESWGLDNVVVAAQTAQAVPEPSSMLPVSIVGLVLWRHHKGGKCDSFLRNR